MACQYHFHDMPLSPHTNPSVVTYSSCQI